MKNYLWIGLLTILASGVTVATLQADEASPKARTITVDGNGKLETEPDIAHISAGVSLDGKDVETVAAQVRQKVRSMFDAIKAQGIAEKDIQTRSYNIQPKWDYNNGQTRRAGYTVSNTVVVTVHDLAKTGKVLSAVVEAGANTIDGPNFDIENIQSAERRALALAMADAQAKATVLAEAADAKLGEVQTITQSGVNWDNQPRPMRMMLKSMAAAAVPEEPVAAGEQTVNATVSVTFALK